MPRGHRKWNKKGSHYMAALKRILKEHQPMTARQIILKWPLKNRPTLQEINGALNTIPYVEICGYDHFNDKLWRLKGLS